MKRKQQSEQAEPVALAAAVPASPVPERLVDGVPVRTYRGASLQELAPKIRAELGDSAMILRQREGVTGGFGGFFAKRMVEVDVAVLDVPGDSTASARRGRIDVSDGPSVGPGGQTQPVPFPEEDDPDVPPTPNLQPTVPFAAIAQQHGFAPEREPDADAPAPGPAQAVGAQEPVAPPSGPAPGANPYATRPPDPATPSPGFTVGAPSAQEAAGVEAALVADQARQRAEQQAQQAAFVPLVPPAAPVPPAVAPPVPPAAPGPVMSPYPVGPGYQPQPQTAAESPYVPRSLDAPRAPDLPHTAPTLPEPPQAPTPAAEHDDRAFDAGRGGADAAPVAQGSSSFEDRIRSAGLTGAGRDDDPVAQLAPLHGALLQRGLPAQIAGPVVDDTLLHRISLQPGRPVQELLASELARRIPTQPLAGRSGQAVAFVGSSGSGKTRAIARLAAAYGAANQVPVACVTLQDSGADGLLATALAPYGIAVHSAPDAPRALDRITALRRQALVLVDTPGVSPGDQASVDRLATTLSLLELDQVALCLPVLLAAPIARRVLRAMAPLEPSLLVATRADEADLLGGVVAVAIDRRVPLAYVSAGLGRGGIVGADAHEIAMELTGGPSHGLPSYGPPPTAREAASVTPLTPREPAPASTTAPPEPAASPSGPTIDVAAGPGHLSAPWVMSTFRTGRRR